MTQRLFGFTGRPGVGKSAVAKEFAGFDGFPVVNMGGEMKKQYESMPFGDDRHETPDGTWDMAQALREVHGAEGPAMANLSRVAAGFVEDDVVVVDGVRSPEEMFYFADSLKVPTHLVAVTADRDTRLERFTERGGYFDTFEDPGVAQAVAEYEMIKRTEREESAGLAEAMEYANYTITNDGTLADAAQQGARLLEDFDPVGQ